MDTNIVVIVIDALRADRVGALGGRPLTPNIDKLASDAAVFRNAYTTTNVTDSAVTSIQTGRYPLSHGVINHGNRVTEEEKSAVEATTQLPEALSAAGYRTGKFGRPLGRWHRNGFDIYPSSMEGRRAFDESKLGRQGVDEILQRFGNALQRIHPRLEAAVADIYQRTRSLPVGNIDKQVIIEEHRELDDAVINNFANFAAEPDPFYAFIHLMDTHSPYTADPERVVSYLRNFEYWADERMRATGTHPPTFDQLVESGEYPDIADRYYLPDGTPTTAVTDAHYDATVSKADDRVGAVIETLQNLDLYDDSLLIILSDHGESLTEHGIYFDHHGLYDTTIRVPLIIRPPEGGGKVSDELVQITDLAPTINSYVGCGGLDPDGYSLKPVIEEDDPIERPFVLADESHTQRRRMVRSEDSKLIYSLDSDTVCRYCHVQHAPDTEFYDIPSDPGEIENIARYQTEHVDEFREYGDLTAASFRANRPDGSGSVDYEDEDEVKERLEALGYR
jgi:arylsulfatase A-like enzyme